MKVVYTQQAIDSLNESVYWLKNRASQKQISLLVKRVIERCEKLRDNPFSGQIEEYLEHLGLDHRRVIIGHFKIIYRVQGKSIFITDIFDSRQFPSKMKP